MMTILRSPLFRLCWIVFLIAAALPATSANRMTIAQAEGHLTHNIAAEVVAEMYRRLNIEAEFVKLPSKRSMAWANIGKVDAEVGRVARAKDNLPNLLLVDNVPIKTIKVVIVTKNTPCDCTQWSDLKNFNIGIRRGEVYAEKGSKGLSAYATDSYHQLLSMLDNNRIDVAVGILSSFELELKTAFLSSNLRVIEKPIMELPLYHLIHKKHRALLPKLNKVLMEMDAKGEIENIEKRALNRIIAERKQKDNH